MTNKKINKRQYYKYKSSIFSNYVPTLIGVVIGALITIYVSDYFTLKGYDLSFPDYPNLIVEYQVKNPVNIISFSKDNLPKNFGKNKDVNPYALNISFRLINKGRPGIKELIISLWGEGLYYPTQIIGPIKGKNGVKGITLPLIFWCRNNSSVCDLDSIPLGKKVINIYVYCDECGVKLNNYPIELCIYDVANVTISDCIGKLNYFPKQIN